MEKQGLYIEPRTKLFLLLTMNIIMLNTDTGVLLIYLRFAIGFLPFLLFLTIKKYKTACTYLLLYLVSHLVLLYVLENTSGVLNIFLGFFSFMNAKFVPGGMMGMYFLCSTRVNEFVASMERMHLPQKVMIPIAVMFRFFPTVKEEAEGISTAMRMRKLGFSYFFSKPVQILEYRLVPLMIAVVNIGEELSAAALTRCLGFKKNRSNISRCGFGMIDYLLFAVGFVFIALYFLECWGIIRI